MFGICTNKKQVICVSLIVFEVLILSLAFFSYANKDLESYVVGIETKLDKNMFKVMLEDSSGGYTESVDNTFPSYDYFFNVNKSGCIDSEGNKLDNSLVFDINTRKVSINVSKTSYCYLYFDKLKETNLASKLITDGNMWQSGLEGDGYRFVGSGVATSETSPDNFICFGTTDQTECKNNESKYLYRIIGVFQDSEGNEHVKLIKYKQIGSYTWNSANTNVSWETSNLYNGLNGTYFLTNTEYDYMQNADWTNKIANWKWTSTNTETRTKNGLYYNNVNPSIIYLHELNQNRPSTYQYYAYNSSTALYDILSTGDFTVGTWTYPQAKIGLMYGSDYALSLGNTAKNMVTSTNINKDILKTGWMHQSNNDTSKHADEYTLSRSGIVDDSWWCAWYVSANGYINDRGIYQNSATRPVFYLESNVGYQSGTGDYIDPIIIGEENRINATNDGANVIATVSTGEYELHKYCINTSQTNLSNCEWRDASTNITDTLTESGDYYLHVVDKGGYVMHSEKMTYVAYEQIQNYTMLYDNGDECTAITGGWERTPYNSGVFTKNSNNIYATGVGNDKNTNGFRTINLLNLDSYSFIYNQTQNDYSYSINGQNYSHWGSYLSLKKWDGNYDTEKGDLAILRDELGYNQYGHAYNGVKKIYKANISTITRGYFEVIYNNWGYSETFPITMYNAWLTKSDNWQQLCAIANVTTPSDIATLLADTTSLTTIFNNENAVEYMAKQCTGDFMAEAVQSTTFKTVLDASPYKNIIEDNVHWAKFLAMTS